MKAILVIDFGDDDIEDIEPVSLSYRVKSKDLDMGYYLATKNVKLKPLPEKLDMSKREFEIGWNACIDELLGEEE